MQRQLFIQAEIKCQVNSLPNAFFYFIVNIYITAKKTKRNTRRSTYWKAYRNRKIAGKNDEWSTLEEGKTSV